MSHISEIVEVYLKSKGMRKISGDPNDASPLLPLIMMDSAYQMFCKYVKPVECQHEMKKIKKDWIRNYELFNKDFFTCFNDEQTDFLIDMMDDFEKFIEHDLFIAFIQFENQFIIEPIERQEVLSACLLGNVLTQSAEIVWERVYLHCPNGNKINERIIACERLLHNFGDRFYGTNKPEVDTNKDKDICNAVDILCKKMINYLRTYIH